MYSPSKAGNTVAIAPQNTQKDTKTSILDAAEVLMAEHGINGISLRSILAKAGANSAALHYHFSSREGVVEAILARRGRKQSLRRLELIASLEARDEAPDAHDIVNLFVDPLVEMLHNEGEAARRFIRFIARLQSDRAGIHQREEQRHFPELWERMGRLLRAACPYLPDKETHQRAMMVIDTMLQSLANADVMCEEWEGDNHKDELADHVKTLKNFLAGGLSAHERDMHSN